MSKAGYIMKVEIFVPFDPNDPASVASAAKIVADENFGGMEAANCDIKVLSSRMVMKRKAAEAKTEAVEIERVETPDAMVRREMARLSSDLETKDPQTVEIPDFMKRKAS